MTPERLAEIRSYGALNWNTSREMAAEIVELADALEQAWAERDDDRGYIAHLTEGWNSARERAERAEAVVARVRGLCDDPDADPVWAGLVHAYEIRAAIEGDR